MTQDFEFYETPAAFTRWLFREVPIGGQCFEPCVGSAAIIDAALAEPSSHPQQWRTNDLDTRWTADHHQDARYSQLYRDIGTVDWIVSNPPFTLAIQIISCALAAARVGVAMHLRASIHEVLKRGEMRTWFARHPPAGILWLPRFAYQRSKRTGKWATDSVGACWVVWQRDPAVPKFIEYAPESVIDELKAETKAYRARMDLLMKGRAA